MLKRPLIYAAIVTASALSLSAGLPVSAYASEASEGEPMMSEPSQATEAYAGVLARNLTAGPDGVLLFDYASAQTNGDHELIKAFISEQAALTPSAMGDAEATAYWANLYNAVTLDVVLDEYPVESIRKIGGLLSIGPWKQEVVTVEGETLSPDNIEHDILRVDYASPYIHYMVNCASIGCPNLRDELWTAEGLKEDQRAAAAAFINSDRGVKIDRKGRIAVSKIYKWFSGDFGASEEDLRAHLAEHARGERLEALTSGARFKGSHYNWDLNQPK